LAAHRAACGRSGTAAARVQMRDLSIAGRPVRLVWSKHVWRSPEPQCTTKTWSEHSF
jgi:transposase